MLFITLGFASEVGSYYGVVERQMGVGIYICSIPVREFDTVCVFKTTKDFYSYPGPSLPQFVEGIQKPMDALADKAVKKSKKNKNINAIISRDGKTAVAVHFKTEIKPELANRALVDVYKGYALYIQNKPLKKYKVLSKIKFNNQIKLDDGNNYSLNSMLDSLIKNYEKKNEPEKANALITTSCVEAEFIKIFE